VSHAIAKLGTPAMHDRHIHPNGAVALLVVPSPGTLGSPPCPPTLILHRYRLPPTLPLTTSSLLTLLLSLDDDAEREGGAMS